jgi:hypothetical protein
MKFGGLVVDETWRVKPNFFPEESPRNFPGSLYKVFEFAFTGVQYLKIFLVRF